MSRGRMPGVGHVRRDSRPAGRGTRSGGAGRPTAARPCAAARCPSTADERLHGVVREHAAAAALARAGVQRRSAYGCSASGSPANWKAGDEVDALAGLADRCRADRSVGQDHRRARCARGCAASVPTGGLSQATTAISPAMLLAVRCTSMRLVDELATDQREAHLGGAVELAVGDAEGVGRRDQPYRQVVTGDSLATAPPGSPPPSPAHRGSTGCRPGAHYAPDRVVDLRDVLPEELRRADPLDVAAGVGRHETVCAQGLAILGFDEPARVAAEEHAPRECSLRRMQDVETARPRRADWGGSKNGVSRP